MARKNTDGSPIGAYSCPSSQRGCAVVNELSAVQFYCPRATKLSLPVHDLPSQSFRSNGGYCPTALQPFRSFPCAHSAVRGGFCPMFLLCCALANPRLYNTQPHDVTELKLCNSAKLWENSFAKYRTLRKNPQTQYSCGFADLFLQNDRFWKCLLTFWTTCYILYLSQILSVFAKYDTLRNFFMEKDAPRRPFVVFRVRPIGRQTTVAGALDAPPLLPYREKSRKGYISSPCACG